MFTSLSCARQNVASVMDMFRENCPDIISDVFENDWATTSFSIVSKDQQAKQQKVKTWD